ncbi:MAG: amino acid ABC transporter permease [Holophaga sp.]|nr:amino acid ABC transporter permease [Holophaga sp.]
MYKLDFGVLVEYLPQMLAGLRVTFVISLLSIVGGTILGVAGALSRISRSRVLNALAVIYVEWIRNTPLLIQLLFIYFGLGVFLPLSAFLSAVLALSIFSGAYITEIIRAGIQSIHKGQREAALSLGMSEGMAMRLVILPQAFKRILPPLAGQFISLIKDSSLVSVIAVTELTYAAKNIVTETFRAFEVWMAIAVFYFALSFILSRLVRVLEKRMARSD